MRALVLAAALAALAAPAPAAAASILDYGWGQADAHEPMGSANFDIWVNKKRDTILMESSIGTSLGGGGHMPEPTWRLLAEAFVKPLGCGISDVRSLSKIGAAWEATFVCPAGVDLRAAVRAQRSALQHGAPIHP